jgi:hypothetical protein
MAVGLLDPAAEHDKDPVPGALDHAPVMRGDGGIDQIAADSSRPRQRARVLSSSAPASRLYPTTPATKIAASLRVSLIAPLLE